MWPFYQCCERKQPYIGQDPIPNQEGQPVFAFFDYLTPVELSKNLKKQEDPLKLPNIEEEFFSPIDVEEYQANWDKNMMIYQQSNDPQQIQAGWDDDTYNKFQEWMQLEQNFQLENQENSSEIESQASTINTKDQIQRRKSKLNWTKEEDKMLKQLVEKYGQNWGKIKQKLPQRSARQCRDRYTNALDSKINRSKWTEEEDRILIDKFKIYGGQWQKIATFLPNRPDSMVKNRFYSSLKKRKGINDQYVQNNQLYQNAFQNQNEQQQEQQSLEYDLQYQNEGNLSKEDELYIEDQEKQETNQKPINQYLTSNKEGKHSKDLKIENSILAQQKDIQIKEDLLYNGDQDPLNNYNQNQKLSKNQQNQSQAPQNMNIKETKEEKKQKIKQLHSQLVQLQQYMSTMKGEIAKLENKIT